MTNKTSLAHSNSAEYPGGAVSYTSTLTRFSGVTKGVFGSSWSVVVDRALLMCDACVSSHEGVMTYSLNGTCQ